MPKANEAYQSSKAVSWNPGEANPKQKLFLQSKALFTCYGGAKGGGKTHILRVKAIGGALSNDGIKILIMRQTYPALEENHIRPICNEVLPLGLATYNDQKHLLSFRNGSIIRFGHWSGDDSELEYNGQEYDWIFIDEATQFTERAFNFLGGLLRGVNAFPKRMYLTCNPGGVGHNWVKRLFIDKEYRTYPDEPERDEHPEDYNFIFATVEDNTHLLEASPMYLKNLANMPEDIRKAYRYGDWNIIGGNYFKEFHRSLHTMPPFKPPAHWTLYRSFDYGLDKLACFWWAVDEDGRSWAIREYEREGLAVQDAAAAILEHTLPGENITITYAPPDVWNRQKDTGRTMAELFALNNVPLVKSDNNRVQGHMMIKDLLAPRKLNDPFVKALFPEGEAPDTLPAMMFFSSIYGDTEANNMFNAWKASNPDLAYRTGSISADEYYRMTGKYPAGYSAPSSGGGGWYGGGSGGSTGGTGGLSDLNEKPKSALDTSGIDRRMVSSIGTSIYNAKTPEQLVKAQNNAEKYVNSMSDAQFNAYEKALAAARAKFK